MEREISHIEKFLLVGKSEILILKMLLVGTTLMVTIGLYTALLFNSTPTFLYLYGCGGMAARK